MSVDLSISVPVGRILVWKSSTSKTICPSVQLITCETHLTRTIDLDYVKELQKQLDELNQETSTDITRSPDVSDPRFLL